MSRILITGAAGFIGSCLSHELVKRGHDCVLVDNFSGGDRANLVFPDKTLDCADVDILDDAVSEYFDGVSTVLHLAAVSSLPECQSNAQFAYETNVSGTLRMLELSRRIGVSHFILASTSAIYENTDDFPTPETDRSEPTLVYPMTKNHAEDLVRSYAHNYGMPFTIMRYYNVYGPHQNLVRKSPPVVGYIIRELMQDRRPNLHSDGTQKRDYVFIDDLIDLNVRVVENAPSNTTINVASGDAVDLQTIYALSAALLGSEIEPEFSPPQNLWKNYPALKEGALPFLDQRIADETLKYTCGATRRAKDVYGWSATTSLEEGLSRTIDFVRERIGAS